MRSAIMPCVIKPAKFWGQHCGFPVYPAPLRSHISCTPIDRKVMSLGNPLSMRGDQGESGCFKKTKMSQISASAHFSRLV